MWRIKKHGKLHLFNKLESFRLNNPFDYGENNILCDDVIYTICQYMEKIALMLNKSIRKKYLEDVGLSVNYTNLNNMLVHKKYIREITLNSAMDRSDVRLLENFVGIRVFNIVLDSNDFIKPFVNDTQSLRYIPDLLNVIKPRIIKICINIPELSDVYAIMDMFVKYIDFARDTTEYGRVICYIRKYSDFLQDSLNNDKAHEYIKYKDLKLYCISKIEYYNRSNRKLKILLPYHVLDWTYLHLAIIPSLKLAYIDPEIICVGDREVDLDYSPYFSYCKSE